MTLNITEKVALLHTFKFFQEESKLPSHWEGSEVTVEIKPAVGSPSYKVYNFVHRTEGTKSVLMTPAIFKVMHEKMYVFHW